MRTKIHKENETNPPPPPQPKREKLKVEVQKVLINHSHNQLMLTDKIIEGTYKRTPIIIKDRNLPRRSLILEIPNAPAPHLRKPILINRRMLKENRGGKGNGITTKK